MYLVIFDDAYISDWMCEEQPLAYLKSPLATKTIGRRRKSGQRSGTCMKNDVHGKCMHWHSRVSPFEEVIIRQSKLIFIQHNQ